MPADGMAPEQEKLYKKPVRHIIQSINNMQQQISPKNIIKQYIKIGVLIILSVIFIEDYFICSRIPVNLLYLYLATMIFCLMAFLATFIKKFAKLAYVIFALFLSLYFGVNRYIPEIYIAHQSDFCLEQGKIYDFEQNICRDDCVTWDSKLGCIKD